MKCIVAMMQHETNTFSPLATPLKSFASGVGLNLPPSGQQAIGIYGKADFAFAAMIEEAQARGAEISIPIAAYAEPSGKVSNDAFEFIADKICTAVSEGCDALLLDLHGAMVTESFDDGEGELLRRVRNISPNLPIAIALDFHTNLTEEMVNNSTVIDGYRTYPHIDMYETGKRAAKSLFRIIEQGLSTRICWRTLPMMTHMIKQTPSKPPMKDIMDRAIEAADSDELLNVSVLGGFPLADIPHVSLSVVAVESMRHDLGEALVNELCEMAWNRRQDFIFEPEPLSQSIKFVADLKDYPVVVADHGDNCGAGGSADDLTVLEEMLNQGLTGIVAGPIWDPQSVEKMINAGEGSVVSLDIGGKTSISAINQVGHSLHCEGSVEKITDGRFTIEGPMQTGLKVSLGRSVLLDIGAAQILVCEERWEPYDTGCFTQAGIDPLSKKYILVKSRQHFRAGFEPIAKHIVLAAGPGVCSSDYSQFQFKHLPQPIYPLDLDTELIDTACRTHQSDAR